MKVYEALQNEEIKHSEDLRKSCFEFNKHVKGSLNDFKVLYLQRAVI